MLKDLLSILHFYAYTRRVSKIKTRAGLEAQQEKALHPLRKAMERSPFYRPFAQRPMTEWPIMQKREWMERFDTINTAGILRRDAETIAMRAERERDFRESINGITVGLSTGTSGARGLFLASRNERAQWAGAIMAKLLPKGLLQRERIALVLRADSGLYGTVASGSWMQFRFFDSSKPLETLARELHAFAPTILVGPPSVLSLVAHSLSANSLSLALRLVVSSAEVIDELDRKFLISAFHAPIAEVYQATEGFLGATCRLGRMHLNEEFLVIEKEWIDEEARRFVPIVTDLYRFTQPVIRYRLNDVLTEADACPCGATTTAIQTIEGREDDVFWLPAKVGDRLAPIFPDVLSRQILAAASNIDDYAIVQTGALHWTLCLKPNPSVDTQRAIREQLRTFVDATGTQMPAVEFDNSSLLHDPLRKRRRVRREWQPEHNRA